MGRNISFYKGLEISMKQLYVESIVCEIHKYAKHLGYNNEATDVLSKMH